ncbi:hypothetical protein [Dendrosporobacter sp. 1207_IL3150]|uniref:hypothetical protein n=1 Tax=Dendrosporobacter sp. 1207_IL3150 TaxID=3084054 RepID=UPI002FDB29B0
MVKYLKRVKEVITRSVLKDSFNRDILTLLIVSILIGSIAAGAISYGANAYFSKTLASLVGDYGEYDLIIQAREEMKEDTAVQIQKIIDENFQGARLKEGPTITGKTNFFIALPEQYRTKQIYENLGKIFGSIPGGAGAGVLTEPKLNVRGVPEGAKNMLIERIMQMDGVKFAFRDGNSVGVIMTSLEKTSSVNQQIKAILNEYQVIEISFPVGAEPSNPIRLGEAIAGDIKTELKADYAQNVSIDGKNDDMTYMVSTMMELKRFLSAYASQVTIKPNAGAKFMKGDVVAFQGAAATQPAAGNAPISGNVLVSITAVRPDGIAEGVITQGDSSLLTNNQGYKLANNLIGEYIGSATYHSPRQQLSSALTETSKLVGQIPGFAQDTKNMSQIALGALDNYSNSIGAIEQTLKNMQTAGTAIQAATSGLANINTSSIQNQLDSSSRSMGGLISTLQVVKLLNPEAGTAIDNLTASQNNLNSLKSGLSSLDNIAADARSAKYTIDNVVTSGNSTLASLRNFDAAGARSNLTSADDRLAKLQQLDVPLITAQLQYMAASAPNLKDEDISHSVSVLDKFIDGQVIPGQRIQVLTSGKLSLEAVTPVVHKQVGHNNVSLYSSSLGVIEPNTRSEVYQLLNEVKAILAGMAAVIVTILFLVLDHTAVMTVMRRKRLASQAKIKISGWRGIATRVAITFTSSERQYGMLVGAVMLTAMFLISGGGIPYLPVIGVPLIGAVLGLIVANYADKISPISGEELMAGESLGMSFDEVMREIVVPSGRPGLLQKLNNRKVMFK